MNGQSTDNNCPPTLTDLLKSYLGRQQADGISSCPYRSPKSILREKAKARDNIGTKEATADGPAASL